MFCDDEKCKGRDVVNLFPHSEHSLLLLIDNLSALWRESITLDPTSRPLHFSSSQNIFHIIKKDGSTQAYDKSKIVSGMLRACEKRPVSINQIENIVFLIEKKLIDTGKREVNTTDIGDSVIRHLYEIDQVAYIRFASVYRSFDDLNEFLSELNNILKK